MSINQEDAHPGRKIRETPSLKSIQELIHPCKEYLCGFEHNKYGVEFLFFQVKDAATNEVFMTSDETDGSKMGESAVIEDSFDWDSLRSTMYEFPVRVLNTTRVKAKLIMRSSVSFPSLRMIEKHYFKDELIKSFDFQSPACTADSLLTWQFEYDVPEISENLKKDMIASPNDTKSDSFYFVNGELIMHTKSIYSYKD